MDFISTIFKFLGDNWPLAFAVFLFSLVFPHLYPEQMTGDLRNTMEIALLASACMLIAKAAELVVHALPEWKKQWTKSVALRRKAKERDDYAINAIGHLTTDERDMLVAILGEQADATGVFRKWWPSGRDTHNYPLDGLREKLIVSPALPPGRVLATDTAYTELWAVNRGVIAARADIIEKLSEK